MAQFVPTSTGQLMMIMMILVIRTIMNIFMYDGDDFVDDDYDYDDACPRGPNLFLKAPW